jgi:YVTN family beta-propeller protein
MSPDERAPAPEEGGGERRVEGLEDPRAPWEELVEDPNAPRRLLAVLFTDIVSSTEIATALGDTRWRELLDQHDAAIRTQLARYGGTEVDTAGDAFFATFELPIRAVDCALESARAVRRLGLRIRAGIHMGECVVTDGKVRGVSVHIGARVGAKARGDEVLVSSTVRDILAGAGLKFAERGDHTLKGVDGRWRLYAVEPRERDNEADLPPLVEAEIARPPVSFWRRRRTLVAGVTALVLLAAGITYAVTRGPGGLTSVAADSVATIDAASGAVESAVSVGRRPVGLTATADGVWVANSFDRTVSRIPLDGKSIETIGPVGSGPAGLAASSNLIWVANSDGRSISRVSPQTKGLVGQEIQTGNGLSAIAFGAGAVWIANAIDGTVWRIDPATGKATNKVEVANALRDIVATSRAVWTVSETAGTLTRLDPRTAAAVRVIQVGNGPRAIAVGAGAVWVANAFDGTVSRVDPDRGVVVATIRVGRGPRAVAVARGSLFVANETDGTISVVDPTKNAVSRIIPLKNAPMGLAASGDRVYVSVRGGILQYKGGTFKFGTAFEAETLDPQFGWNEFNFAITTSTHDGLLSFKRVGGIEGAVILPDLADDFRPPTDGGTTYTFTLRRGLRYSNNTEVHASDVRKTFERAFQAEGRDREGNVIPAKTRVFFGEIKGTSACSPTKCDLSAGIVTDDTARTVAFHLTKPVPDFPYFLAHPLAAVLPPDTPVKDLGMTPIPGTGPYFVASVKAADAAGEAILKRNTYFVSRGAAQPDGYPDQIDVSWGKTPDDHVNAVRAGREDWTIDVRESSLSPEELSTSAPGQFHLYDLQGVQFATLNPTLPPFNDPRVRRAVNFAADRRAMAAAVGAPLFADVTCQILPKDVFGYVPYCPFTRNPNAGGNWTAPDLATAKRLVAESGTRGQKITMTLGAHSPRAGAANVLAGTLRALGYRAQVRLVDEDVLFTEAVNPKSYQSMFDGWIADYPSAGNFFPPLLKCAPPNASPGELTNLTHFCSPAVDKLIAGAYAKQQSDLLESSASWAAVDRAITDAAPWVPYATFRLATIVSPRVGNIQYNPALGVLLTQMWLSDRK